MTRNKVKEFIKMENMRNILPIVRKNENLMNKIKTRITKDVEDNNKMIIETILETIDKSTIDKSTMTEIKTFESEILALDLIINGYDK